MPLNVPENLPAIELLSHENIFIMGNVRAEIQDIRPLKIAVVNLMPLKIQTEKDILRLLSNSPLQISVDFIQMKSHVSKNTSADYLAHFYKYFNDIKNQNYDGLIITGAPLERVDFEEVDYWNELTDIIDWSKEHVTSTLYICWAAFAGLYHNYGINKHLIDTKISGVFSHTVTDKFNPLFRGFDDVFYVPHSRFIVLDKEELLSNENLTILSESERAGIYVVMANGGKEFYITGHSEYSPDTLDNEYKRDLAKGLNPAIPENYYIDDDPQKGIIVRWRAHANLLFTNWLNYYVYQVTPFDAKMINNHGKR